MLETDEVDIDYFTPDGSSSLASIFGKGTITDEVQENPSLKYVPLPPPEKSKSEEVKPTQWIFTCTVHGFEWLNSEYISRGKLGLALLKVVKTNSHSIIIYDSNKITLSYVPISRKLNIHIRDVLSISYYDSNQKYWSIQTSREDMNKMIQLLKDLQATIITKPFLDSEREQSGNNKVHDKDDVAINEKEKIDKHDLDNILDMNQQTKDSILKRMANMGHSVLPPHVNSKGQISDSSDSSDTYVSKTKIRQKPIILPKKYTNLSEQEKENNTASHSRKIIQKSDLDGQTLVPSKCITSTSCGGDMNIFISEQKLSNSELRINVNRVSDKLDIILERLNSVTNVDKNNSYTNFQNDIVQKLIKEYEAKIMNYEHIMLSKGIDFNIINMSVKAPLNQNASGENNIANMTETDVFLKECKEKDNIISTLEKEIKLLNENNAKINEENKVKIIKLEMEIKALNENLTLKSQELDSVENNVNTSNQGSFDIANKVKKIMNDTFEAISVNFDDNEAYSGEKIKAIIAIVIKKTTVQALQEL